MRNGFYRWCLTLTLTKWVLQVVEVVKQRHISDVRILIGGDVVTKSEIDGYVLHDALMGIASMGLCFM